MEKVSYKQPKISSYNNYSALEVFTIMSYINLHFTYLLLT